ncbi:hypothetical protein PSTT_14487 [Puccinia striiformis]|uniref:Retrotransposon gag domain-containing protein n=1 Tax=Puccinia striiformis TaxID=27350 RepID=A0A2S4UM60_9BASI|nr:hypothetical protein PSTT_14487 [Puccinia striiformis]
MSENSSPSQNLRMGLPTTPLLSNPSQNLRMDLPTTPSLINLSSFLSPTPNRGPSLNSPNIMNTSVPLEPIPDNDPTFSTLLSGLQMENPGRDETVLSHAQAIANLEAQGRRTAEILRRQAKSIKELSSSLTAANEIIAAKPNYQAEFLQIRTGVDNMNQSLIFRLNALESQATKQPIQLRTEPPYIAHLYFSGGTSYFKASKDDYVGKCALQTWWRGLLSKNADVQGLDTKLASSAEDYVIEELLTVELFLAAINEKFVNTSESDDDWKEFEALRQGKKSMSDFNIQFTTLLRQLHPSPNKRQPVIITIRRWIKMIVSGESTYPSENHFVSQTRSQVRGSTNKEIIAGGSYGVRRDNSMCWDFDVDHQAARGCILPDKDQLDEEQAKSLWVQWGGALRDNSAPAQNLSKWSPEFRKTRGSSAPATPFVRGKKRESISEMTSEPAAKKNGAQISPTASSSKSLFDDSPLPVPVVHGLDSMSAVPMTVGEYLFERQVMDIDDAACKQSFCVKRSSLFSNRPFFDGKLALQKGKLTDVSVLVDSGASTSFIDSEFVHRNDIAS